MSEKNPGIKEAASYLRQLSEDEKIKLRCEARERYYFDLNTLKNSSFDAGKEKGIEIGETRGADQVNRLNQMLITANRLDDLKRSIEDSIYQKQLMHELGIIVQE